MKNIRVQEQDILHPEFVVGTGFKHKKTCPKQLLLGQVDYKITCGATRLDMESMPT